MKEILSLGKRMQDLPTKKQAKVKRDFCIQNSVAHARSILYAQWQIAFIQTIQIPSIWYQENQVLC